MNKHAVLQLILEKLTVDLDIAQRAAQTAYETATHEENIAENKYDTLGLRRLTWQPGKPGASRKSSRRWRYARTCHCVRTMINVA